METKKSLCELCKNKLHIKFLDLPFKFDRQTGEQIQGKEIKEYDTSCIYFNSSREGFFNRAIIIECNQYKKERGK